MNSHHRVLQTARDANEECINAILTLIESGQIADATKMMKDFADADVPHLPFLSFHLVMDAAIERVEHADWMAEATARFFIEIVVLLTTLLDVVEVQAVIFERAAGALRKQRGSIPFAALGEIIKRAPLADCPITNVPEHEKALLMIYWPNSRCSQLRSLDDLAKPSKEAVTDANDVCKFAEYMLHMYTCPPTINLFEWIYNFVYNKMQTIE